MTAGFAFVILNLLRTVAICSLLMVCASSAMIVIREAHRFGYNFFDILSQFIRIGNCVVLIASEIPVRVTTKFLIKRIPVLTEGYSLAWTGVPIITLSCSLFSALRSDAASSLGHSERHVIFAAALSTGISGFSYLFMPIIYWCDLFTLMPDRH